MSRLVRSYLEHGTEFGTLNWDVVVAKCLFVVLVAALGSRSGDVVRALSAKENQHMTWRHIDMFLDPSFTSPPKLSDLRAVLTSHYGKGDKDVHEDKPRHRFRPLDDNHRHVYPINLLLAHALRHGLVEAPHLQRFSNIRQHRRIFA